MASIRNPSNHDLGHWKFLASHTTPVDGKPVLSLAWRIETLDSVPCLEGPGVPCPVLQSKGKEIAAFVWWREIFRRKTKHPHTR